MSLTVLPRRPRLALAAALAAGSLCAFPLGASAAMVQGTAPSSFAADNSRAAEGDEKKGSDKKGDDKKGDDKDRRVRLTSETKTVLPNVDDDSGRCAVPAKQPVKFKTASVCHDGADNVVNGAEDAKDLTLVTLPAIKDINEKAAATLSVPDKAKGKVRVFVKEGDKWSAGLTLPAKLTAAQLKAGMTFGVEATDVIRDAKAFDGKFSLDLEVKEGDKASKASLELQVAKLTPFSTQDVEKVVRTDGEDSGKERHQWPGQEMKKSGTKAQLQVRVVDASSHQWSQDHFEAMYASMTQGGKQQNIRVLALAHTNVESKNEWYAFRGKDTGVIALTGPNGNTSLESTGNVEGIGAYTKDGKKFAAGRLIMGHTEKYKHGKMSQVQRSFFESNADQKPIYLDTSFLSVGHVDEFIHVVPAKNERGWMFAVASPKDGVELLKKVDGAGKGDQHLSSPPKHRLFDADTPKVKDALKNADFIKANEIGQQRIDANVEILKKELGFNDSDFLKVPILMKRAEADGEPKPAEDGGLVEGSKSDAVLPGGGDHYLDEHTDGSDAGKGKGKAGDKNKNGDDKDKTGGKATLGVRNLDFAIPDGVNAVSLDAERILVPDPYGPKLDGKDVFVEAINAAHSKRGAKATYVNTYFTYHMSGGEVHCGTNVFRQFPSLPPAQKK
ncbi:protein-arginine deiminase family protein [Austwickia chelonae]|uniref:protein-arginine deiminase family protein n=1 Tax=Austwickia chelonae TaxID=100225 RepID=UPI000E25BA53|nr:protein-arginine deiminase family protein [Austwickia chelonae]